MKQQGKDIVQDGMMGYSAYVLLQRAIPSLYDGLKISYRRILYSMHKNKVNQFTKSQNIAGEVAKIHPHSSVYTTMVGMAQTDRHIHPFIDGKGYFGEYTSRDVTAAAERYTNVRMNDFGRYLLKDINKNQVSFSPSYDGTQQLPDLLPVKFPIILAFAQSGMGVGFSSTTVSYNIGELSDCIINYLETGEFTEIIPDFATGGELVLDEDVINNINNNGRGTLKIRAKAEINKNTISITEIPYSTTREAIIDKVIEVAKTDKLKEVTNIQDLTGLNKTEILITARKNTDMDLLLEKLYNLTPLESTYSVNSTVLYDDRPRLLGTYEIIKKWIDWRLECIDKELQYDISKLEKDKMGISALEKISEDIDFVVDTIRKENKTNAIKNIRNKFKLTFEQSEYIYSLHLRQLNDDYIKDQIKKLREIEKEIKKLKNADKKDIIISDMKDYKNKFSTKRRTKLLDGSKINKISRKVMIQVKEDLIDDNDYWITITENMYIYKTKNKTLKLKGDKIIDQYKVNNAEDEVFAYTLDRSGYKAQIRNIELYSGSGLGTYLPTLLGTEKENITKIGISSINYPIVILLLTDGRIVKFSYEAYRSGVNVFANTHTENYDITHALFLKENKKLNLIDVDNKKYSLHTKDIRETKTRTGTGQYINNRRKDIVKLT